MLALPASLNNFTSSAIFSLLVTIEPPLPAAPSILAGWKLKQPTSPKEPAFLPFYSAPNP
ncbi:MAG: hypothetical protein COX90_03070 [Candidatus Nealsonbacteria bacterium CG_4_10_14_0_2_um_filter_38_17]|uniref:Uncharacterized protein n=1 Tax=Candidatus Nealsonbacteria bacterium CG_4_10_14_0_2_um_filter_38_17 TaxID=1974680 RepID=A0A2M7UXS7_9BACT|nr:MAG: hypothetical protein COX90_03070 [Candidatus Nealsonbacteria bacterium CG_4_10_14_0_2_um_filter_38_17]